MPGFPDPPALSDGSVTVRLAAERDIPEVLIAYQDDPDLHRRMGSERPPSGAELGRLAERAGGDRAAGRRVSLTILEPGSDTCRGQIYVHQVDWENARAELAIWIAPGWRDRGMARAALALVAMWLLRDCGLARVQVVADTGNDRMLAAARGAGFSYEGVLRGYTREGRQRVDNVVLAMVRGDLAG